MTGSMMTGRSLRRAVVAAIAAGGLLLAGCGADDPAPPVGTVSGAQSDIQPPVEAATDDPAAPVSVTVAGVTAPTDSVATDVAGVLLPPQDVDRLGWWVDSALPGNGEGTVVITGHINEVDQGDGFAARFLDLDAGDTVTVTTAADDRLDYRITSVDNADKESEFPADRLNRLDGPETLALITCGGEFVGPPLGYADNVIAWAEPA